jgi:hypothetical protein
MFASPSGKEMLHSLLIDSSHREVFASRSYRDVLYGIVAMSMRDSSVVVI